MKPTVVIPLGDVAGIGPEIVIKALNHPEVFEWCRPLVVGERSCLERAMNSTGINMKIVEAQEPEKAMYHPGTLMLVDLRNVCADEVPEGKVSAKAGRAAYEFIEKCTFLLKTGVADVIATTPINKEALHAAQVPFIGHTEILAALLGAEDPMTMFQVRSLRVFFLSRHMSLRNACEYINEERVYSFLKRSHKALAGLMGVENPRMAVAGLNPHCGEHGLFGDEEVRCIAPAIEHAQADGLDITGTIGADSVFHQALEGAYDAVISLYHDQGHIATKMVDFERTISLTLGMPYLRTSVDHGTALNIAGKNLASEVSMVEAIRLAALYAPKYKAV